MYDQRNARSSGSATTKHEAAAREVGRTTRVQQLGEDPVRAPGRTALFEGVTPRWEEIDAAEASAPPWPLDSLAGAPAAEPHSASSGSAEEGAEPTAAPADALHVVGPPGPQAHGAKDGSDEHGEHDGHDGDRELAEAGGEAGPVAQASGKTTKKKKPHDPLHIAGHHKAHEGPYEHKIHGKGDQHRAATDPYNRKAVHSDHSTAHVAARPGLSVEGRGVFQLKSDTIRYTYTAKGKVNVAVPFDLVPASSLRSLNHKGPLTHAQSQQVTDEQNLGRTMRLLLNPAHPKDLTINNQPKPTPCVLSWIDSDGGGAAWLPISQLVDPTGKLDPQHIESKIKKAAGHLADKEDPALNMHGSSHYLIRHDQVSQADDDDLGRSTGGGGRVLAPGADNGDNVSHYLEKEKDKQAFDANGQPITTPVDPANPGGPRKPATEKRRFVAISMNLPEGHTPPVAVDTAIAGDSFFAFNDQKFHREVAVYENKAKLSHRRQKWVFGHLGMHKGSGKQPNAMVPDPKRAGWVPLRVLTLP